MSERNIKLCVKEILNDLRRRKGIGDLLDEIAEDKEVMDEIKGALSAIVRKYQSNGRCEAMTERDKAIKIHHRKCIAMLERVIHNFECGEGALPYQKAQIAGLMQAVTELDNMTVR